jgi:hypothetical protein
VAPPDLETHLELSNDARLIVVAVERVVTEKVGVAASLPPYRGPCQFIVAISASGQAHSVFQRMPGAEPGLLEASAFKHTDQIDMWSSPSQFRAPQSRRLLMDVPLPATCPLTCSRAPRENANYAAHNYFAVGAT